jgi:hypothetical protein
MAKFFNLKRNVEVTDQFVIKYSVLTPISTKMEDFIDFYCDLEFNQQKNKPNIITKNFTIYIITKIKLNKKHLPITLNPIFKFKHQFIKSKNIKNNNLIKYRNNFEPSFFDKKGLLNLHHFTSIKVK